MTSKKRVSVNDRQLPFKLSAMTVGAQRAYDGFVSFYGLTRGRELYLKKAAELGTGNTIRQKANSIYKVGAKVPKRSGAS